MKRIRHRRLFLESGIYRLPRRSTLMDEVVIRSKLGLIRNMERTLETRLLIWIYEYFNY